MIIFLYYVWLIIRNITRRYTLIVIRWLNPFRTTAISINIYVYVCTYIKYMYIYVCINIWTSHCTLSALSSHHNFSLYTVPHSLSTLVRTFAHFLLYITISLILSNSLNMRSRPFKATSHYFKMFFSWWRHPREIDSITISGYSFKNIFYIL